MTEQFADLRQSLARRGLAAVCHAAACRPRPPALDQGVRGAFPGIPRKQVRVVSRPALMCARAASPSGTARGPRSRHPCRCSASIEHFAAAAAGERQQPDRGDGLGPACLVRQRAPEPCQVSVSRNRASFFLGFHAIPRQGLRARAVPTLPRGTSWRAGSPAPGWPRRACPCSPRRTMRPLMRSRGILPNAGGLSDRRARSRGPRAVGIAPPRGERRKCRRRGSRVRMRWRCRGRGGGPRVPSRRAGR